MDEVKHAPHKHERRWHNASSTATPVAVDCLKLAYCLSRPGDAMMRRKSIAMRFQFYTDATATMRPNANVSICVRAPMFSVEFFFLCLWFGARLQSAWIAVSIRGLHGSYWGPISGVKLDAEFDDVVWRRPSSLSSYLDTVGGARSVKIGKHLHEDEQTSEADAAIGLGLGT